MSVRRMRPSGWRPTARARWRSSGSASAPGRVAGHHYALVVIADLPSRAPAPPYEVRLDGELVWPLPGSTRPPSRIRTRAAGRGRCRSRSGPAGTPRRRRCCPTIGSTPTCWTATRGRSRRCRRTNGRTRWSCSAIRCTPTRRRRRPRSGSGSAGTSPQGREGAGRRLRGIHLAVLRVLDRSRGPLAAVHGADVDDLRRPRRPGRLEHLAVLAADMQAKSWWQERIVGALSSYWVYQHLGNLSPAELAENELYQTGPRTRRGRRAVAPRVRRGRRPRGGRGQGRALVVPPGFRAGPAAGHRFAVRPDPGPGPPEHAQRRRVRLDRASNSPATTSTC